MGTADVKIDIQVTGSDKTIAELARIERKLDDTGRKGAKAFGELKDVATKLNAALGTVGLALSAGALVNLAKDAIAAGDSIATMAKNVNATVTQLSALMFVSKQAGVGQDELAAAMARLSRKIIDLQAGSKDAVALFRSLNLSAADFNGLNSAQAIEVVARALDKFRDSGAKAAWQMEVFGKSGYQLNAFLSDLSRKTLPGAIDEARKYGAVWSDDVAKKMAWAASVIEREHQRIQIATAKSIEIGLRGAERSGPLRALLFERNPFPLAQQLMDLKNAGADKAFQKILDNYKLVQDAVAKAQRKDLLLPGPPGAAGDKEKTKKVQETRDLTNEMVQIITDGQVKANEQLKQLYDAGEVDLDAYYQGRAIIIQTAATEEARLAVQQGGLYEGIARAQVIQAKAAADVEKNRTEWLKERHEANQKLLDDAMKLRQAEYDASWVGRAAVAQEQLGQNAQEIAASGLEDVFSSWAYQGRSLIGVLQGIGQAMVSLLSRAWALKIMGSLFGGGGGGGGGIGTVGEFMSLTPIRRADGGIISGPGTGTSDSIPALVSNGEYIVPAAAVSRPGVFPLLESLRAGVAAPISRAIGALPRFASGGLVTGGGQVSGTMTFGLAEGLTLQHMSGFAGQRVVLETLARNRHAVRQMIK